MKKLWLILGIVDKTNEFIAKFFSWGMLLLVLTMTYEVVSRYAFRTPTIWSYDISYFLSSLVIMMGMAYTLKIRGHVNIDIFYGRFSPRIRAAMDIFFALLLFFPLWLLMLMTMYNHVAFSWAMQEKSWVGTWLPVIYPFKAWVSLGVFLLVIQAIAEFIRDLYVVITGGERP